MKPATALVACICVAAALVGSYVALGAPPTSPRRLPTRVPRPARDVRHRGARRARPPRSGDQTACALGVSREELVWRCGASTISRISPERGALGDELEDALRTGLARAVDQARDETT